MIAAERDSMTEKRPSKPIAKKLEALKRQLELEGSIARRQILLREIWRLEKCPDDIRQPS